MKRRERDLFDLYTDYLMSSTSQTTATGLSAMLDGSTSHDKITRLLSSEDFDSMKLWKMVKPTVRRVESEEGVLIFDDTIQEKTYMGENEMNCYHFDHSKGRSVKGVNILNSLYSNQDVNIPVGYEIIKKPIAYCDIKTKKEKRKSEKTKNEIFRNMIDTAMRNQIVFGYILADIWFCSTENMKHIKLKHKKDFIMGIKENRLVALSIEEKKKGKFVNIKDLKMETDTIQKVYLKGMDFPVFLFKKVFTNKDGSIGIMYLVCSNLKLTESQIYTIYQKRWKIEEYHKSMKCNTALGKSPARTVRTQGNHIFASMYAYFKFELLKIKSHHNHFKLKSKIYIKALKAAFAELQKLKNTYNINSA